ncbi:hypothetical protein DPX16_0193 [Anabarilius grahami]|uniref:Uncharacterized protein n=1 Tax=Anabarilius grahami TaxID=495550 RepID=A0A3N0ZAP8_ANAGA|nr:hypothetical protein DPX16_0193 [Anabarilius grahami]
MFILVLTAFISVLKSIQSTAQRRRRSAARRSRFRQQLVKYLSNNVVEDPDNDPPEPQNTEASAGEDVRDNLAAGVSAPDNCVRALHEHDYL